MLPREKMSFELAVREGGVGTKIPMNKVDVGQLPIYKDIKGIYPFYAPTESGKTVIAREFMKHVLQQNDIQMVLCFTPAHRPEWDDLFKECNERGIAFEYVLKHQLVYCATLMDMQEETFARKGTVGKIVMIWDDQMGAIDMTMAPWHEMCRTMASRARHDEINIVWLILAQDPTAVSTVVRSNAAVTFFTMCPPRQLGLIFESVADCIDIDEVDRVGWNYQFVVFDRKKRLLFVTKANITPVK